MHKFKIMHPITLAILLAASLCAAQDETLALLEPGPNNTDTQSSSNATTGPLSPACNSKLAQLQVTSNLPVVFIQLANVSQVPGVNAAQLQLLAKGPHLPGLMTTCGAPGDPEP